MALKRRDDFKLLVTSSKGFDLIAPFLKPRNEQDFGV